MADKNYITPAGLAVLKKEFSQLMHDERPKVVATVAWAASNGDRSENADYIYGKRKLREIDRRIRFLGHRIEDAEVVDPSVLKSDKIVFGATVTIRDDDDNEFTYQIVGEDEFDIKLSKISWKSPVAKALLGKKVGDGVSIQKPQGIQHVTVEKIQFK